MGIVVCFKHPSYDGKSVPNLSCKVCCTSYVNAIKAENAVRVEWKPQLSAESQARIEKSFQDFKQVLREKLDETSRNNRT